MPATNSTGFVPIAPLAASAFHPCTSALSRRPPSRRAVVNAVLDTPASNTYLQRHAEVVLRDFLTRRAVNTVMYYMQELHDGPAKTWLDNFEQFEERVKNGQFHRGDVYLERMLMAQNFKGTLKVGHPSGRFSRTYNFVIEPNRIARRILESRIQLAQEWERDLNCIEMENLEIQRLGFEKMFCRDETELDSKKNLVFECDPMGSDQTPLRWRNYQMLKTLVTRHAVARLLPYIRDCGSNHEYMYMLAFVRSHGVIMDGDQFIRELMDKPIEQRTNPNHTIVPRAIALQLLEIREAIAKEWIDIMKVIPEEQRIMNLSMLERSFQASHVRGEDLRQRGVREEENVETDEA